MDWVDGLPDELRLSAYKTGTEYAWSRRDALEVVSWLKQRGVAVLGVDVWLPTTPGPTIPAPYVYDWDIEIVSAVPGAPHDASEFVKLFRWHAVDQKHQREVPYFAIDPVELQA